MKHPNNFSITRRQALYGIGAGVSLAVLPGCTPSATVLSGTPEEELEAIAYRLLAHEPERATSLGVDVGEYAAMRGQLEDQSQAGQDAYAQTLREDLERIRGLDKTSFDADTRTSFEVVESAYATSLDGFDLPYGDVAVGSWRNAPYVVIQNVGSYIDLPRFMDSTQPLENKDDAEAFLSRLREIPLALNGELSRMQAAREMGVVPPDFLLDKAIPQMEAAVASARSAEAFSATIEAKETEIGGTGSWATEAKLTVGANIADALERQLDELKTQRGVATSDPGISARPDGEEWYAWALRASTTTNLTADEVHEQGLEELASLHGRMDPILKEIGYTTGSVGERMQQLGSDPRYKFAEGDPGRAEIMSFINERVDWIKAQMPRAFNTLVDPKMEVKRIPPNEEMGAPGAYGGAGSKDGTIPGRMWINLRSTDLHRKYDLADLTYHETIPGHVWEGEYSNRLPLIRSILAFNAFSEGWALYGEQLADELGAYDDFAVGRLGYLQSLAFRACRMVVDTGLHHKGWSRDQSVNFFVERNGSKRAEVESEVDRYCSWPGQATGYKLGHSRITDLRGKAETELGDAYDMKAFNDAVILGGNAPMDVLANNVDRYIAGATG